jgi:hypothetical protein
MTYKPKFDEPKVPSVIIRIDSTPSAETHR